MVQFRISQGRNYSQTILEGLNDLNLERALTGLFYCRKAF